MDELRLTEMLDKVRDGSLSTDEALAELRRLPFEDIGYAKVDHHRAIRVGYPEVIFCQGKTKEQIAGIVDRLMGASRVIMGTRCDEGQYAYVASRHEGVAYHREARIFVAKGCLPRAHEGSILVVSAGTSDIPIAEEAAITCEVMGNATERLYDVGVAGIHRLLAYTGKLAEANVIIVVAGMEGALASVVGGLVDKPVIAVPTSVGYGANFGGLSALLTMLNSCASGVGVVNIDNGFGAGYLASTINRRMA